MRAIPYIGSPDISMRSGSFVDAGSCLGPAVESGVGTGPGNESVKTDGRGGVVSAGLDPIPAGSTSTLVFRVTVD